MKAYGAPRSKDREFPDVGDIQAHGMPSRTGRLPEPSGDYKSYTRKAKKRKQVRRYWKRKARKEGKQATREVE